MRLFSLPSIIVLCLVLGFDYEGSLAKSQITPKLVTLSLKRALPDRDLHPEIRYQQQINRNLRRMASIAGNAGPSNEELQTNIRRRALKVLSDESGTLSPATTALLSRAFNVTNDPPTVDSLTAKGNASITDITPAANVTGSGDMGISIFGNDVGYFIELPIGNPPRLFRVQVDSGSGDLWVMGEGCQSVQDLQDVPKEGDACGDHVFLGASSSTTFIDTNAFWTIGYGDGGALNGSIVKDDIIVGGHLLQGHTFGIAVAENTVLADSSENPLDGIMGLAQSKGNSNQQVPTPVEALKSNGLIDETVVSFYLGRVGDEENHGEVTFGGLDESKFDPTTKVTLDNFVNQSDPGQLGLWIANMDGVSVNGQDLGFQGRTALFDTGTNVILGPEDDLVKLHNQIEGAVRVAPDDPGFKIPCNTSASVTMSFGGQSFLIKSRDLLLGPTLLPPIIDSDLCFSGLQISNDDNHPNQWLLGATFLKSVYFSVNTDTNEITLAQAV